MSLFWTVHLDGLPRSLEPALTEWLFRQGSWGTEENLDFKQPLLEYAAVPSPKKIISLKAYFDHGKRNIVENRLRNWLKQRSPLTRTHWECEASKDWLAEWKKHFKPFRLAGFHIVPTWYESSTGSKSRTILVEPGMAFGTGTHATTQFAIRLLKNLAQRRKGMGPTVLDVGAGSGILSVVAEKLGATKVTALDSDPECWRECRKMFKLNKTKRCAVSRKQLKQISEKYDVVVANIIDGILMNMKESLWRATRSGGYLVLSGILTSGAKAFVSGFLKGRTAKVVREISDSEWTSFIISK